MRTSAVALGLAGLAAAGVGLVSHGSSTAAPIRAEVVASECSPGKRTGWANREQSTLRIGGKSVPANATGEIRRGDLVQTDPDGAGIFCLRIASLECDIDSETTVQVLPPRKPNVLLRLIHSEDPFTCTAILTGKQWELETGAKTRVLIGEAKQEDTGTHRVVAGDGRDAAPPPRSAYALSLVVGKKQTLVKVRRGATIVTRGNNTQRAVVLGRQQQVVVPAGRDPSQPTKITLKPSEKRTFKELEKSLPAVTDKTPPAVTIQGPRNPSSVRSATFSLRATDGGATFSCALDGSDFRLCTSPYRIDGLKPGQHTFAVRSTDATGNTRTSAFSWSIDSSRIAFVSDRNGNLDIYAMDPDGTSQAPLTTSSAADDAPEWSPTGGGSPSTASVTATPRST